MKQPTRSVRSLGVLFAALIAAAGTLAADSFPSYELSVIPFPETDLGVFDFLEPTGLNQRNEVVGTASNFYFDSPAFCRSVGFRFQPGRDLEIIDTGLHETVLQGQSDTGHVFGYIVHEDSGCVLNFYGQDEIFRYHKGTGFDYLEKGRTDRVRSDFIFRDANKKGHSVGFLKGTPRDPMVYTDKDGWRNLRERDPRLDSTDYAAAFGINDAGEILVQVAFPGGYQQPYLVTDDEVFDVGHLGTQVTGLGLQRDGSLVGSSRLPGEYQYDGADHAVIFTPEDGLVDIHAFPEEWGHSFAHLTTPKGVTVGVANRSQLRGKKGDVFLYDDKRGARFVLTHEQIAAFVPEGLEYRNWGGARFNQKLELIGRIDAFDPAGGSVRIPFLYHETFGPVVLQDLVDQLAPGLGTVISAADLNDAGSILLLVFKTFPPTRPSDFTWVVLTRTSE